MALNSKSIFRRGFRFWFVLFVISYSIYDYLEHVLRRDSIFQEHPFDWLLFTVSSVSFLLVSVLLLKYLFERLFKTKSILLEAIAIGLWLTLHIKIIGPLMNHIFWPHDKLLFMFSFSAFFKIIGIYFVLRLLINLIRRKPLFG